MNLLIADDHTLFRDALSYYIKREAPEANILCVEDVYEAESVLNDQDDANPIEIILLDLLMPGMNGMQGISKIVYSNPDIPVLLMSGVAGKEEVKKAISLGCVGFFPKTLSCKVLIEGLKLIQKGEKYIPIDPETGAIKPSYHSDSPADDLDSNIYSSNLAEPDIHDRWLCFREEASQKRKQQSDNLTHRPKDINLTKREKDVLSHLVCGERNKDIAEALGVKTVTVKLHVRSIFRKLDVSNRTQAALCAKKHNIIG